MGAGAAGAAAENTVTWIAGTAAGTGLATSTAGTGGNMAMQKAADNMETGTAGMATD